MNTSIVRILLMSILLLTLQVIVLNRIHLFGYATPMLLVYTVILLPLTTPRWASLLLGFVLGFVCDVFTNTPGVATITLTFIAFVQSPLLKALLPQDTVENISPSLEDMGMAKYVIYSATLTLAYCLFVVVLENFSFSRPLWMGANVVASTVLTYIFIFTIENIRKA